MSNAPIQYWRGPTEDEAKFEFEFGAGMGYSTMVYSDLKLSASSLRPGQVRAKLTLAIFFFCFTFGCWHTPLHVWIFCGSRGFFKRSRLCAA